jgi:DNA-binding NtrC family response regulator
VSVSIVRGNSASDGVDLALLQHSDRSEGCCAGIEWTDVDLTTMTDEHITILVVDDEQDIADLYTTWLEMDHEVRTAYSGEQALENVDSDVDIVFLDRQMPDYSGDEVLEQIRDRQLDCRVVMVTAVDPDFDILSMEFDEYLTKPVMREDLDDAVESMLERDDYDETLQEYFALTSKKATLEAEKTPSELQRSEQYQQMVDRVEELEAAADTAVSGFDDDFDSLFQEFPGGE